MISVQRLMFYRAFQSHQRCAGDWRFGAECSQPVRQMSSVDGSSQVVEIVQQP